jgi:hypothetical protein
MYTLFYYHFFHLKENGFYCVRLTNNIVLNSKIILISKNWQISLLKISNFCYVIAPSIDCIEELMDARIFGIANNNW